MGRISLNIAMVAACPFPTSQGSQVLIRELSEALVRLGHRVHIVTYHFGELLECPGLVIHRIPERFRYSKFRSGPEIRKPILDLLLARKLAEVVRDQNIHLIHAHNYEAPVAALPACRRYRIPLVYHSHNTMSDEFYTYFRLKIPQTLARAAAHLMDRWIPRQADFIIAINPRVAAFLIEMGAASARVKYIPPGIDYGDPPAMPDRALRVQFGLGDGPLIFYVGNLDGYQRPDLLLNALPDVFASHPHAKLVLITGSDAADFQRQAQLRGLSKGIMVLRHLPFHIIKALLAHGTLAVNSRISWSGFPIKLLNYMAAGLPIVAFEGAAWPVINGQTGLLAVAGDARAFAQAVNFLLANPLAAHQMGRYAQTLALQDYSWSRIAADIERIYYRLLGIRVPASQLAGATAASASKTADVGEIEELKSFTNSEAERPNSAYSA